MTTRLPLSIFFVLSLADLFLTWVLLNDSSGRYYESNPIANWFLQHMGWMGMAGLKAAVVLVVAGIVGIVRASRPALANRVLVFGCLILAGVVGYSSYLYLSEDQRERTEWAEHRRIQQKMEQVYLYRQAQNRLAWDVIQGSCRVKNAVEQLSHFDRANDPQWLDSLQRKTPWIVDRKELIKQSFLELVSCLKQMARLTESQM